MRDTQTGRERHTNRQSENSDRQADAQTVRDTQTSRERQTDGQSETLTDRQMPRQINTCRQRDTQTG